MTAGRSDPPPPPGPPVSPVSQAGRVGPRRPAHGLTQLPVAAAFGVVLAGLLIVRLHHFRAGSYLMALGMLGAAGLRLVLPARRAGLLVVRSRGLDVAMLTTLGVAVLVLAKVVRA